MDSIIEKAKKDEYVETILGRRRYLRNINAQNFTMRGFAERMPSTHPYKGVLLT